MSNDLVHILCRNVLRLFPVVCAMLLCVHCLLLFLGCAVPFIEWIYNTALLPFLLMMVASYALHFCVWHRLCIVYCYVVSVCISYQRHVGFGDMLQPMRLVVFVVGFIVVVAFVIHCLIRK